MLTLNNDEIERIKSGKHYVTINSKNYYVKKINNNDGIELVTERLAKLVNINSVHYERVVIDDEVYYLSEDLNKDGKYLSAKYVVMHKTSMIDMFDVLNKYYDNENILYLIDEIIKIFIFDILILNYDRHLNNWGFTFKKGKLDKVYILDNEYAFYKLDKVKLTAKNTSGFDFNRSEEVLDKNLEELDYIISTSDLYYYDLFKSMYRILTPEVVEDVFECVELEYGISIHHKDILLNNYVENYNKIGELFKVRTLK